MTLSLSGRRVTSASIWIPWRGAWVADVQVDLDPGQPEPSGPMALSTPAGELSGVAYASATGRFANLRSVRLVGGRGGWARIVGARHHHNDGGVRLSHVLASLAAEVGEVLTVEADLVLGADYVRQAGLASSPLDGREWHVDFTGQTKVAARALLDAPASVALLQYDPAAHSIALDFSDVLPLPGMRVSSPYLTTPVVLQDVLVTYSSEGSARAQCSVRETGKLSLRDGIRALAGDPRAKTSRSYRYRVVGTTGTRHDLQAIQKVDGLPDVVSVDAWPGIPGLNAEPTPGGECLVSFVAGDPAQPVVTAFQGPAEDGYRPVKVAIDATEEIRLGGPAATLVALAERVDAALSTIVDAYNAHTHPETGGTTSPTAMQVAGLPGTAATKTFAE